METIRRKILLGLVVAALGILSLTAAPAPPTSPFHAGEVALDAFGAVTSPDLDAETLSYGVGAQLYLTRNLGVGVSTSLTETEGHFFENVSFRGLWRVPIERHALYAFGGVTRYVHDNPRYSLILGPGYEWRPVDHLGFFGEVGMEKELTGTERSLAATARLGIRLSL